MRSRTAKRLRATHTAVSPEERFPSGAGERKTQAVNKNLWQALMATH